MKSHVEEHFGGHLRIRVCGVLANDDRILLVKHKGVGVSGEFWAPPGGGVEFGISVEQNLVREMKEETGLNVEVGDFMMMMEFLKPPLHAIELFYRIAKVKGKIAKGTDPELPASTQLISEVRFVTFEELAIIPNKQKHKILHGVGSGKMLLEKAAGFLKN